MSANVVKPIETRWWQS